MALTADDLAAIRSHIGSGQPPTDLDLGAAWDRLGSVEGVALEVIRGRRAEMLARPARLAVDGDYTESWEANLKELATQAAELEGAVAATAGTSGVVEVARLTRAGRSR